MALLINKLFSNKKKNYIRQTDVGDRTFSFSKEQVRVVLFRECDFRGRKLLFDSQTVQKVPISSYEKTSSEKFVEISNGYGYLYTKPNSDTIKLGETIFGTVAMSYHGTLFKIHSFTQENPKKLMCTLVFPSPKSRGRFSKVSVTNSSISTSNSSGIVLEKSEKLTDLSSSSAISSGRSTDSDIKNITTSMSVPLDVPLISQDSGIYTDQSLNSMSSGTQSLMLLDGRFEHSNMPNVSFSCGSLYKRWFRSASTSLENNSTNSDINLGIGSVQQNSASADDCLMRNHHRSSKLGLAIILDLTENKETEMETFLLKHAALIEAMVYRSRVATETAYNRPISFASLMYDIYQEISQYLNDLLLGKKLNTYYWHEIGDQKNQNQAQSNQNQKTQIEPLNYPKETKKSLDIDSFFNFSRRSNNECENQNVGTRDQGIQNWTQKGHFEALLDPNEPKKFLKVDSFGNKSESNIKKFYEPSVLTSIKPLSANLSFSNLQTQFSKNSLSELKSDNFYCDNPKKLFSEQNLSHTAHKFIKELCEVLENFDIKSTNFFISTLLTAVLTNHLGWVSTVLPPSLEEKSIFMKNENSHNPLWGQLTDLYGACGHPTKMSRTIVCGKKNEVIEKILSILTYFIRCGEIEKNFLKSFNFCDLDLRNLEEQLPKNLYQKENIEAVNVSEQLEMKILNIPEIIEPSLPKTKKNSDGPKKHIKSYSNSSIEKRSLGLQKSLKKSTSFMGNLNSFQTEFQMETFPIDSDDVKMKNEVVFVLGENEELKNLKKSSESINKIEDASSDLLKRENEENNSEICKTHEINSEICENKQNFSEINSNRKLETNFILDKRKLSEAKTKKIFSEYEVESPKNSQNKSENTKSLSDLSNKELLEKTSAETKFLDKNDSENLERNLNLQNQVEITENKELRMFFEFDNQESVETKVFEKTESFQNLSKSDFQTKKVKKTVKKQSLFEFGQDSFEDMSTEDSPREKQNLPENVSKKAKFQIGSFENEADFEKNRTDFDQIDNFRFGNFTEKFSSLATLATVETKKLTRSGKNLDFNKIGRFSVSTSKIDDSDLKFSQNDENSKEKPIFDEKSKFLGENLKEKLVPEEILNIPSCNKINRPKKIDSVTNSKCKTDILHDIPSCSKISRPTDLKIPKKIFTVTNTDSSSESSSPLCQKSHMLTSKCQRDISHYDPPKSQVDISSYNPKCQSDSPDPSTSKCQVDISSKCQADISSKCQADISSKCEVDISSKCQYDISPYDPPKCQTDISFDIPSCSKISRPTDLKISKKIFSVINSDSSPESPMCQKGHMLTSKSQVDISPYNPKCQTESPDASTSKSEVDISSKCQDDISSCSECKKMRERSSSLHLIEKNKSKTVISHSSKIDFDSEINENFTEIKRREGFDRSQSVPPSDKKQKGKCSKLGCKKKYAGVKFDMRQYPQIVTQYLKSKDLEMSQLHFGEKSLKLNRSFSTTLYDNCLKDFPSCDCEHDTEVLTTPSNASELEFNSDLENDFIINKMDEKKSNGLDFEKPSTSKEISKMVETENQVESESKINDKQFELEKRSNSEDFYKSADFETDNGISEKLSTSKEISKMKSIEIENRVESKVKINDKQSDLEKPSCSKNVYQVEGFSDDCKEVDDPKSGKFDDFEILTNLSVLEENLKIDSVFVTEHPLQKEEEEENQNLFLEKKSPKRKMDYKEFLIPRIEIEITSTHPSVGYTHTLLRGVNANYISDLVLQGTTSPLSTWEQILKRDLKLTARQPLLDQPIQEAVAIVANTDTWEVQLVSSHSYAVERGYAGVRVCLSQLVANMLESLLYMWKLRTPPENCLSHIESKLHEFCLHSKTMAQILLNTDFCNMEMLTSALQLEVNDIPLLMAVASTHTPQVTQKYGLSFQ